MKTSSGINVFIAALASFIFPACAQYADTGPSGEALWGTWNWEISSGGFTGKQVRTPETAGYAIQIRFAPDGEYLELHDGKLIIKARYAVVIKDTIFRSNEVICFSDSTGRLGDKVIMRVTATSLYLSDPYPDGYGHSYVRAEE